MALQKEGLNDIDARTRIFLIDSKGLITTAFPRNDVLKDSYAKQLQSANQITDLLTIVNRVQPTVLIGASAQPGSFTSEVLSKMAQLNRVPVVLALSNPTSKAECTAEQAYRATGGKALYASGSPFPPVTVDGHTFTPGQANNIYIFPAVAAAVVACEVHTIPDEVFLVAAEALASLVTPSDRQQGALYPPLQSIRATSHSVSVRVAEWFFAKRLAHVNPEPSDKAQFLKYKQYEALYNCKAPHSSEFVDLYSSVNV